MLPGLSFAKIGPESEAALRDLFEPYLREMADWFEVDTNPDGSYAYDIAGIWEKGYDAYLAQAGDCAAGFALVGSAEEWAGHGVVNVAAHDVHEFFVRQEFRRQGAGRRLAAHIWNEHPGEWLVRVLEANTPAQAFWRRAIAEYAGGAHREEHRLVNGRAWVFFWFTSVVSTRSSAKL